jgi:hypothetical protein
VGIELTESPNRVIEYAGQSKAVRLGNSTSGQ